MTFPPSGVIKADLGIKEGGEVHKVFTETCKDTMIPFIPYSGPGNENHLNANGKVDSTKPDEIYYDLPYAHYMYMGILYVDPKTGSSWARKGVTKVSTGKPLQFHHPGTGAFWDQRMWTSKGDEVIKTVQKYVDRTN